MMGMLSQGGVAKVLLGLVGLYVIRKLISINPYSPSKKSVPKNASVLITGCDHGFGRSSAVALAQKGFKVFAGCLTQRGIQELQALSIPSLVPFEFDVTNSDHIQTALSKVQSESPEGLFALVNNAGIMAGHYFDWTDFALTKKVLDVNLVAVMEITKVFLPLMIQSKGRIINVASIAGLLPFPGAASYSATKHAVLGFSKSLRMELKRFDVDVITIGPGFMRTPLVEGMAQNAEKIWNSLPQEVKNRYGQDYFEADQQFTKNLIQKSGDPAAVVAKIVEAVASARPQGEYWIGVESLLVDFVPFVFPWVVYFKIW